MNPAAGAWLLKRFSIVFSFTRILFLIHVLAATLARLAQWRNAEEVKRR
jgi:hypothetical protein